MTVVQVYKISEVRNFKTVIKNVYDSRKLDLFAAWLQDRRKDPPTQKVDKSLSLEHRIKKCIDNNKFQVNL